MIKLNHVFKQFKIREKFFSSYDKTILNDIDCEIEDGEIVAIIGLNGSGKSTLLKCITGVVHTSLGEVQINHIDAFNQRKKLTHHYGVYFNNKSSFLDDISIRDNFELIRTIYDLSKQQYNEMFRLIDSFLEMRELVDLQYRKLSLGQRVRCDIASILFHKPAYIFLDEPTNGLDGYFKLQLIKCLKYYNETYHSTILFITHELDFITNHATRILLLNKGHLVSDQTIEAFNEARKHSKKIILYYTKLKISQFQLSQRYDVQFIDDQKIIFKLVRCSDENDFLLKVLNDVEIKNIEILEYDIKEIIEEIVHEGN